VKEYIVKKIIYAVTTLFIIASLTFVIYQVLSPLDPTQLYSASPTLTYEHKELMKKAFGLDQPIHIRYVKYIINTFTFNFGFSFGTGRPVVDEMLPRLRNTLLLLSLSLTFNVMLGIPVGIMAASRRGSKLDMFAMSVGLFTWGAPIFYVQLLFVFFLANPSFFQLFPSGFMISPRPPADPLACIADVAYHLALPLITLVVAQFGWWAMYTRNMMVDSLTQDYIVTERAIGLKERTVLYKHAFRATLPPIVTMVALIIPTLFMGGIITELIFSWPGIGRWFLTSTLKADYPAAQALIFIYAVLMVGGSLLVDLIYGFLDPRIRVGVRR